MTEGAVYVSVDIAKDTLRLNIMKRQREWYKRFEINLFSPTHIFY
jgi:hypothetical protein